MKKINILVFISMISLLVGCGGESDSSLPKMDNSKVRAIEIRDGYYAGEDVLFAGNKIVGNWFFFQENANKTKNAYFSDDGDASINLSNYQYGVSKDGKKIIASSLTMIEIKYQSIRKNYIKVEKDGKNKTSDCYNVEYMDNFGIYNVIMCPSN